MLHYSSGQMYVWYCYLFFSGTPFDSWMPFKPDRIHARLDDSLELQPDLTFATMSEYLYIIMFMTNGKPVNNFRL